jgi:hypothetical protein
MCPALGCDFVGKLVVHVVEDRTAMMLGGSRRRPVELNEAFEEIVIEGEMLDSVDDIVLERFDFEILGEGPEVDQTRGPPS